MGHKYRDGRAVTDIETSRIMIATLLGGYQTVAFTTAWILLHLAEEINVW